MGLIKRAKDNYFILGGIDSRDFDMVVSCDDAFAVPERDVDTYEVPGRNGDLIVDNGRFRNIDITYDVVIEKGFPEKINAFKRAVGTLRRYARLEDTFDPDVYRMANVNKVRIEELGSRYNGGAFKVTLNCKPQKFLKSGEQPIVFFETYVSEDPVGIQTISTILGDNKTLKIRLHIVENDTRILLKYNDGEAGSTWDTYQFPSPATGGGRVFPAGDYTFNVELPSDAGAWRLIVAPDSETGLEGFFAEIDTDIVVVPGDVRTIHGILAPELRITNPTGFVSKPIIEYLFLSDSNIRITNIEDGEQQDFYEVSFTDVGNIFMDCDQQYAYDYLGNNVSDQMSIITAEHADGRSLVFPEFGADTIKIDMLQEITPLDESKRNTIVFIYPRWWTV